MLQLLRQRSSRWLVMLALLEITLLTLCVRGAAHLRYIADPAMLADFSEHLWPRALLVALVMTAGMAALGLYERTCVNAGSA